MAGTEPNRIHRMLPRTRDDSSAAGLLRELRGVDETVVRGARLRVTYDLTELEFPALVARLREAGLLGRPGLYTRLRTAWYGFLDRNTRENLQSKGGACCSDPREIYLRRRR